MADELDKLKRKSASLEKPPEVKRVVPGRRQQYPPNVGPQTAAQLQAMAQKPPEPKTGDPEPEPVGRESEEKQEQEEKKDILAPEEEPLDIDTLALQRAIKAAEKRRAAIEARCEPMSLDDLLELDEIKQEVPIIPDKLVVTFRSLSHEDYTNLLRMTSVDQPEDLYHSELASIHRLAMAVVVINEKVLPPFVDEKRVFSQELLRARAKILRKKSLSVLALMHVNMRWFDDRVDKLLDDPEVAKNG